MIRVQRRLHTRVFYILTPLLAALFLYALSLRQRSAAHLLEHPAPALTEKTP